MVRRIVARGLLLAVLGSPALAQNYPAPTLPLTGTEVVPCIQGGAYKSCTPDNFEALAVTSVGLALPVSVFSVSGSPVTTTGTLTGSFVTQAANRVWAGPTTGVAATPTFRALVGADLPNPSATTLGGTESIAAVSHNFLTSISTSGVPAQAQPACGDLSNAGTACQANTGTSGANVPFLNGANTWSTTQTFTVAPVFTDQSGSRTALGLGTISTQNANTVAITGGTVNAAAIGGVTPSTGAFTTASATTFTGALSGNATTATALATGRTIAITGDLAYTSPTFNGSANVTAAGTLATVNSNVGSFGDATHVGQFTVNGKGLITAASSVGITAFSVLEFSTGAATAGSGSTSYFGVANLAGAEGAFLLTAPVAGTVSNLYATPNGGSSGVASGYTYTLVKNASPTALTCVITASGGTGCNDTTHSVSVAQGDTLEISILVAGGGAVRMHGASAKMTP